MLSLEINNPNIENIFLEGFNANKEKFFEFIQNSYNRMSQLDNFERSIRQAKLQESGELDDVSLESLLDELEDISDS